MRRFQGHGFSASPLARRVRLRPDERWPNLTSQTADRFLDKQLVRCRSIPALMLVQPKQRLQVASFGSKPTRGALIHLQPFSFHLSGSEPMISCSCFNLRPVFSTGYSAGVEPVPSTFTESYASRYTTNTRGLATVLNDCLQLLDSWLNGKFGLISKILPTNSWIEGARCERLPRATSSGGGIAYGEGGPFFTPEPLTKAHGSTHSRRLRGLFGNAVWQTH